MFQNCLMDFMDFHQFMEFGTCPLADPSSYHQEEARHTHVTVRGTTPRGGP